MNAIWQLIAWFVIPAPIIILWAFVTNREEPTKGKLGIVLMGELFGIVSACFIVLFWIDMLIDKYKK